VSADLVYTSFMKRLNRAEAARPSKMRNSVGVPKQEARLQKLLVSALTHEPLKRGLRRIICSEVDVWRGIADVVVATTDDSSTRGTWLAAPRLKHLNLTAAKLLAQLRRRDYRSLADIAKPVGFSIATVSAGLRRLERLGLVRRKGSSARLLHSTSAPFLDVVAFEVKVSDWKHGLYQATHYRSFANQVALALPNTKAKAVAVHKKAFQLFGIGLVGIKSPASITWYVKPIRRRPFSRSRMLLGSAVILRNGGSRASRVYGKQ
jgi:DNA-binding transcriptional ArsR family regulator